MLTEPRIDRELLLAELRSAYGLTADSFDFIPVGWASAAYVLRAGRARYFLKLWPGGRDSADAVARFPLLDRLGEVGLRARVPVPLPTRDGALSTGVRAGVVALFPYLDGTTPPGWPQWPRGVLEELGRTLAELHAVDPGDALPFSEQFSVPDDVLLYLDDPAARPYRGQVLDQLDRLRSLSRSARSAEYVVCHADLVGDNVLVDGDGRVALLDWDGAQLAPAEQDLALLLHGPQPVSGTAYAAVLSVYPTEPRLDLIAFFLLRRAIEDFTARLGRLRHDSLSPAETADAIDGLARWGSDQWNNLDRTLDLARSAV